MTMTVSYTEFEDSAEKYSSVGKILLFSTWVTMLSLSHSKSIAHFPANVFCLLFVCGCESCRKIQIHRGNGILWIIRCNKRALLVRPFNFTLLIGI